MRRHRFLALPRSLVLSVSLALTLALLSACGVPTDPQPRALSPGEVPFQLDPVPATTEATEPVGRSVPARIFLLAGGPGSERLVAVERQVAATTDVTDAVETLLRELVTGPTAADQKAGLGTSISPATTVLSVSKESGIATIDLSDDFVVGSPRNQILALAQLVYTATEVAEIGGVLLTLDGEPTGMLTDTNESTQLPVGRATYAQYGPE